MGLFCKKDVDAKIAGSALVVSFLAADPPKVWRGDMGHIATAAFHVKKNDNNKYTLVMQPGSGETEEIMAFPDRKKALAALESISAAMLEGGHAAPPKGGWLRKLCKFLFVLLALYVLLVLFFPKPALPPQNHMGQTGVKQGEMKQNEMKQENTEGAPAVKTGVPVPASELFGK